jgi:hypothetical protein
VVLCAVAQAALEAQEQEALAEAVLHLPEVVVEDNNLLINKAIQ